MTDEDLDAMAELLGDPVTMAHYPAPLTREEARRWIDWNKANYATYGYGLWIIGTPSGEFVGDCGLTWQPVDDIRMLEVGYHVRPEMQGRGYATEAAAACLRFAAGLGERHLVAIIHPENTPSQRVAEKIGLRFERTSTASHGRVRSVYGADL